MSSSVGMGRPNLSNLGDGDVFEPDFEREFWSKDTSSRLDRGFFFLVAFLFGETLDLLTPKPPLANREVEIAIGGCRRERWHDDGKAYTPVPQKQARSELASSGAIRNCGY